jgi:hypothetical protein
VSAGDAPGDDPPGPTPTVAVGPGARLGRYVLGDELGAGGMATVYRARDPELRRDVAVKVLFPHLAKKADVARRFRREARAAAALEHPNILRVYDVGADDPPYLVMELVRGQSLREIADRDAPLPAELVAAIGALVADALAVAHRARIVHRDVKPANLMLADDGRLLLADFGVARVEDDDALSTKTGALLGTVCFMAPEQAAGGAVDGRSDLFALGVTLYQLAVGALPFTGPPAKIIADAQRGAAVTAARRSSEVGLPLSRVIERLMAPDPAARPADAATAAAELRALVTAGGLGEPRDEGRGLRRRSRRVPRRAHADHRRCPDPRRRRRGRPRRHRERAVGVRSDLGAGPRSRRRDRAGRPPEQSRRVATRDHPGRGRRADGRRGDRGGGVSPGHAGRRSDVREPQRRRGRRPGDARSARRSTRPRSTPLRSTPLRSTPLRSTPARLPGAPTRAARRARTPPSPPSRSTPASRSTPPRGRSMPGRPPAS